MADAPTKVTKPKTTKKATKKTAKKTTKKAAAAPAAEATPTSGAKVRVRQVRSGIGHAETYRRTLRAIGLRHHQHEIVVNDTPSVRGMLHKVRHLVRVMGEA